MYPTTQQPYPQQYPVHQQPNNMPAPSQYPPYPPPYSQAAPYPAAGGGYAAPYPAGPYYGQCPQHQQPIIYAQQQQQQRPRGWRPNLNDPNTCWLLSLLTLCCGCLLGEALCDEQCCCCLIPCALPRFRR